MVSSVSSGSVDVLMMKKAMEVMKQQGSIVTETLAKQEKAPNTTAAASHLGNRIDLRI